MQLDAFNLILSWLTIGAQMPRLTVALTRFKIHLQFNSIRFDLIQLLQKVRQDKAKIGLHFVRRDQLNWIISNRAIVVAHETNHVLLKTNDDANDNLKR